MDKKKIIGIPVIAGVILFLILMLVVPSGQPGDKFEAKVLTEEQVATVDTLKSINLYVDFSGSMRGYIDFAGIKSGKNTFIGTISSALDRMESIYHVKSVSHCGGKKYSKDNLRLAMQNKSIFNAGTTSVQNMIKIAREAATADGISIVASDMIMSWGRSKLIANKDTFYNLTQIDGLGAAIHSEMTTLKGMGLDVMMVQFYSDFNGRYYYNYTENIKEAAKYKNICMARRPYYQ